MGDVSLLLVFNTLHQREGAHERVSILLLSHSIVDPSAARGFAMKVLSPWVLLVKCYGGKMAETKKAAL